MARLANAWMVVVLSSLVAACGGGGSDSPDDDDDDGTTGQPPECSTDADCADRPDSPICDTANQVCYRPLGWQIGQRDGSPASVTFVPVWEPDKNRVATDLQFNPSKPTELWVVNRLDDSAVIIESPGTPEMTWERRRDPAADHFMKNPPAISFGSVSPEWGQTFGVCGDDDQGGGSALDFIGPALFSADLTIFAESTPNGLGSHLDMLHSTSFCRGIEHVADNIYFAFNAQKGAIDRYDFKVDHGPGNDDHSDGEILRFVEGAVRGVDEVPSHLAYDPADGQLYVADSGNARIAKLDTNSGSMGGEFSGLETLPVRNVMEGATLVDLVPPGTLGVPTGLELHEDVVFVSDIASSRFYAFDKTTGEVLRILDTGFAPGSLVGFTFGPDGKVYFVDHLTSRVFRIDPL